MGRSTAFDTLYYSSVASILLFCIVRMENCLKIITSIDPEREQTYQSNWVSPSFSRNMLMLIYSRLKHIVLFGFALTELFTKKIIFSPFQ